MAELTKIEMMRLNQDKGRADYQRRTEVYTHGFHSEFWMQLKEELLARRDIMVKGLVTTDASPETLHRLVLLQAEIRCINVLLNLEKAVTDSSKTA
jgi:hypothetical protein